MGLMAVVWIGSAVNAGASEWTAAELLCAGRNEPLLVAHRGVSARFPENTLSAFTAAVADGAAMLELDVGLSRDGELIVLHDETLDRTTDGEGLLRDHDLEALRRLDAGSWFDPRFAREPVPTLSEILARVGRDIAVNVEIKPEAVASRAEGGIEDKVVALIREAGLVDRVVVSSFEPTAVARVKRAEPDLRTAVLFHHEMEFDPAVFVALFRADGLHVNQRHLTSGMVASLHGAGLYVAAYTANEVEDLQRLVELGVDGIFTDDVARARTLLGWEDRGDE
jgi:glycerophosphoryl diester phosphodiesterase